MVSDAALVRASHPPLEGSTEPAAVSGQIASFAVTYARSLNTVPESNR
jgi:hypothetical protein